MRSVLIVEDEYLIAEMLHDALLDNGYSVLGMTFDIAGTLALADRTMPDLAIIDLRLARGDDGLIAAQELMRRDSKIGILYASGNCYSIIDTVVVGQACLGKPFMLSDVITALKIVEQILDDGVITLPIPSKMHIFDQKYAQVDLTDR